MRKRLSILIALAAASMIAVATVLPAAATGYDHGIYSSSICGGPSSDYVTAEIILDYSEALSQTINTYSSHCYWLYSSGAVEFYNGGGDQMSGGGWKSGYPGYSATDWYYSDTIVIVHNYYDFCNQGMTQCYGSAVYDAP
jgi:hypothetical protein